jgi:hypothetical protein
MVSLLSSMRAPILPRMFVVTEAEAAAIHAVYEQRGELSAAVELRPPSPTPRRPAHAPGPSPAGSPCPSAAPVTRHNRGDPVPSVCQIAAFLTKAR